jgi:hypothetical protein
MIFFAQASPIPSDPPVMMTSGDLTLSFPEISLTRWMKLQKATARGWFYYINALKLSKLSQYSPFYFRSFYLTQRVIINILMPLF